MIPVSGPQPTSKYYKSVIIHCIQLSINYMSRIGWQKLQVPLIPVADAAGKKLQNWHGTCLRVCSVMQMPWATHMHKIQLTISQIIIHNKFCFLVCFCVDNREIISLISESSTCVTLVCNIA